jgi:hypothetical protein
MSTIELKKRRAKLLGITNYIMKLIQTGQESIPKEKLIADYRTIGDQYYVVDNKIKNKKKVKKFRRKKIIPRGLPMVDQSN